MFEPSPAPWTLAEANSTIPVKDANGRTVASVRYGDHDLPDARLIAAAPDLLAALNDELGALDVWVLSERIPVDIRHGIEISRDKIARAIAKATQP